MTKKKWYVSATDTFLSGWGQAEGLTSKLIYECDDYAEAETVQEKLLERSDMKYVNIRSKKPYYSPKHYHVEFKTFEDAPWYYGHRKEGN